MLKCKKEYYAILFSMIFILLLAGSSSAETLSGIQDQLDIGLGNQTVYIQNTNTENGTTDLAIIPFEIQFIEDELVLLPDGNIRRATIEFTYNPDNLEFVGVVPNPDWGPMPISSDTVLIHDPISGTIYYNLKPDAAPNMPIVSGTMILANFEFKAKCQPQLHSNTLTFASIGDMSKSSVEIALNSGGTGYYTPLMSYTTNGWVKAEQYMIDFRVQNLECVGVVGGYISVPITAYSNGKIDGLSFSIDYESEKLRFIEINSYETYFPGGYNDDPDYTAPVAGDDPVHFDVVTGDDAYADLSGDPTSHVIFNAVFEVIGEWDGDQTSIGFVANPEEFPPILARITEGDEGFCEEVSLSMIESASSIFVQSGTISIPAYAVEMASRLVEDNSRIWDIAGDYQDVNFAIDISNNFEAGTYAAGYHGAITAIVDPPDILSFNYGPLEQVPGTGIFFTYTDDMLSFDTLAFYQYYQPSGYSNILEIASDVNVLNLSFELDDADVIGFLGDEQSLDFVPSVSTFAGEETRVEASRSKRVLTLGDGINATAVPFKIATGEFSCDSKTSGTWDVAQQYYVSSSFNLSTFEVTVNVSDYHYVQSMTTATGVDAIKSMDGRSVTFTSTNSWVAGEFTTRILFGTINYGITVPPITAKVAPGPGDCFYRYYYSTIAFTDESMGDGLGNQPFLFTKANRISKRTLICNEVNESDPLPGDYKASHAVIPEDYMLYQNYPNPFNPDTKFAYDLPEAAYVRIEIFNILGQHIKTLVDQTKTAGSYEVNWNATDENGQKVSSGIYLYVMQAGNYSRSAKMTLMK